MVDTPIVKGSGGSGGGGVGASKNYREIKRGVH